MITCTFPYAKHTGSNRTRVDAVEGDIMGLSQLLGPDTHQALVRGLCGSVNSLAGNT